MQDEEEYNSVYNEIVQHEISLMIEESEIDFDSLSEEEYNREVALLEEELIEFLGKYGMNELIYREVGNRKMVKHLVIIE